MVAIAPFRALRYNPNLVRSLSLVVAPPYDVISPEEQNRLYDASPFNVVRLIYGKQDPADSPTDNRYTRAKQAFDHWCNTRVLVRDETPAIYLYEHTFHWQGTPRRRLGFVALLEFAGSVPDQVFCHEATFEEPKRDRARLLDAVRANLSPIFCLYRDPNSTIHAFLKQLSQNRSPLATVHLPAPPFWGGPKEDMTAKRAGRDEEVRMWSITDPDLIRELQHAVEPVSVLVADGHHRFEVALSRRHLCQAVMSYFSWLEDPAVMALPIHRVVQVTQEAKAAWPSRLQALCTLTPVASLDSLIQWLVKTEGHGQFGY